MKGTRWDIFINVVVNTKMSRLTHAVLLAAEVTTQITMLIVGCLKQHLRPRGGDLVLDNDITTVMLQWMTSTSRGVCFSFLGTLQHTAARTTTHRSLGHTKGRGLN